MGKVAKVGKAVTKFNFQVDRGIREVPWENRALFDKINNQSILYSTSLYCSPSKYRIINIDNLLVAMEINRPKPYITALV